MHWSSDPTSFAPLHPTACVEPAERQTVRVLMLAHAMVHTYELSIPLFVSIWLVQFDAIALGAMTLAVTPASVGAVVTGGYALFGLGAVPGGWLTDRIGPRTVIIGCLVGMGVSFLLLAVAPGIPAIAVALLCWGAAASVYHPAGLTLISTTITDRGRGFAYHGIGGNIGIGIGPLVTALLLLVVDWSTVAVVLALPAFLVALITTRVDVGGRSVGSAGGLRALIGTGRSLFAGSFALVFIIVICSGLYHRGVLTFLPEILATSGHIRGLSPMPAETVAPERFVYAGLLLVGVLGQYLGGRLTDQLPVERGLQIAFGAMVTIALGFAVALRLGGGWVLLAGGVLGVVLFFIQPLTQATVAEFTPPSARGVSYGFTYLGVFGVGATGGLLAGVVLTTASVPALFGVLAVLAVGGLGLAVLLDAVGVRPV